MVKSQVIYIGNNSNAEFNLSGGDFVLEVASCGIDMSDDFNCAENKLANLSIKANNIDIKRAHGAEDNCEGIHIYNEIGGINIDLIAEDKISINDFKSGMYCDGSFKQNFIAREIEILSETGEERKESYGIRAYGESDSILKVGEYGKTDSIHLRADRLFDGGGSKAIFEAKKIIFERPKDTKVKYANQHMIRVISGGKFIVNGDRVEIIDKQYESYVTSLNMFGDSYAEIKANELLLKNACLNIRNKSECIFTANKIDIEGYRLSDMYVDGAQLKLEANTININGNDIRLKCGKESYDDQSYIKLKADVLNVNNKRFGYTGFYSEENGLLDVNANEANIYGVISAAEGGKISFSSKNNTNHGYTSISRPYGANNAIVSAEGIVGPKSQIDFKQSTLINGSKDIGKELIIEYNPGVSAGKAITAKGNAVINLNEKDRTYTVYGDIIANNYSRYENGNDYVASESGGTINIGGIGSSVCGDVLAANEGTININLVNGNIEGRIDSHDDVGTAEPAKRPEWFENERLIDCGHINLTLDKSTWKAHNKSWVSELNLKDGIVDLASDESASVAIKKLTGNGRFDVKLNSVDHSKSDMIYIGDGSGNHKINIVGGITGGYENITEDNPLRFATVMNSSGQFELVDASTSDGGVYDLKYVAVKENYDKDNAENEKYNSNQVVTDEFVDKVIDGNETAVNWIITGVKEKEESKAANAIIDMSRANYKNAVYMDRLNKRLGEARYLDGNDGIWVRMRHDRIGMKDEFRSSNTMYQVGYDKLYKSGDAGERHAGVAIDYLDGSTSYTKVGGEGESKRYGLWLYDTWFGDKGHYTDYVVKYGHMKNDFDITAMTTGEQITGDYNNNMFSASAEYGRKHEFGNDWYVEPQVQLQFARITGADYATTQGTDVSVDAVNSLIARAGFRLGKDIDERSNVYIKADIMHEFLGDQGINAHDNTGTMDRTFENKGTWYDLGFGFTTALSDNSYAYLDVEQSFGNDNEDTYEINVGMKWAF